MISIYYKMELVGIKDFNGKLYGLVKFNGSKEHHIKIIEYFKERNWYIEYENDKWGNYIYQFWDPVWCASPMKKKKITMKKKKITMKKITMKKRRRITMKMRRRQLYLLEEPVLIRFPILLQGKEEGEVITKLLPILLQGKGDETEFFLRFSLFMRKESPCKKAIVFLTSIFFFFPLTRIAENLQYGVVLSNFNSYL